MLIIVLLLNMLIAGLCWYGVWQIWRLRQALVKVTAILTLAEQDAQRMLQDTVDAVRQGQTGAAQLRQQYQQVLGRLRQGQQILALIGLGRLVWQQYERRLQRNLFMKSTTSQSVTQSPSKRRSLVRQSR